MFGIRMTKNRLTKKQKSKQQTKQLVLFKRNNTEAYWLDSATFKLKVVGQDGPIWNESYVFVHFFLLIAHGKLFNFALTLVGLDIETLYLVLQWQTPTVEYQYQVITLKYQMGICN